MWAHRDMKIQIPHCLGLTPLFGLDPNFVGAVCGMHHGCGPAPSAGAFYAEARLLTIWSV